MGLVINNYNNASIFKVGVVFVPITEYSCNVLERVYCPHKGSHHFTLKVQPLVLSHSFPVSLTWPYPAFLAT